MSKLKCNLAQKNTCNINIKIKYNLIIFVSAAGGSRIKRELTEGIFSHNNLRI